MSQQLANKSNEIQVSTINQENCYSPKRKKNTFLTQKRLTSDEELMQNYNNLNAYINILDTQVQKTIEKHQAQFILAYRNHVKKVRDQMEEIKKKSINHANNSQTQTEKIQSLQKQLIIFREQSLKLFQKLSQKQQIIQSLKFKLNQLQKDQLFSQNKLLNLLRRNKFLQGFYLKAQTSNYSLNHDNEVNRSNEMEQSTGFQLPIQPLSSDLKKPKNYEMNQKTNPVRLPMNMTQNIKQKPESYTRPHSTKILFKSSTISSKRQSLINKIQENIGYEDNEMIGKIIDIVQQRNSQYNQTKPIIGQYAIGNIHQGYNKIDNYKTNSFISSNKIKSKKFAQKKQMEQIFWNAVETVKKEVSRRKNINSLNYFRENGPMSLIEFKKIDFLRLFELIVANEHVIQAIYATIFKPKTCF